jgi:hypothetical protein
MSSVVVVPRVAATVAANTDPHRYTQPPQAREKLEAHHEHHPHTQDKYRSPLIVLPYATSYTALLDLDTRRLGDRAGRASEGL